MVLRFVVDVLHYMFRPTWPSSGVYDISLFIPEGICFAAFVAFVACCYSMQFLICVCCVSVNFHILVNHNKKTKFATFTYSGKETKQITKPSKDTNIKIA
jgi:hypothetical protein